MSHSLNGSLGLSDLTKIRDYYCSQRANGESPKSIYQIWEDGGSLNDSVTPSSYSPEYRSHITLKILSVTKDNDRIFSIGCGNGFVEAELVKSERRVQAIDCNEEAVNLSSRKGVDAFTADFFSLEEGYLKDFDVIYADGLLGHMFRPESELDRFFAKLVLLGVRPGTRLVISNDPPRENGSPYSPHDNLENFWFLSRTYLAKTAESHGYKERENYYFPYYRPISGLRERSICLATAHFGRG